MPLEKSRHWTNVRTSVPQSRVPPLGDIKIGDGRLSEDSVHTHTDRTTTTAATHRPAEAGCCCASTSRSGTGRSGGVGLPSVAGGTTIPTTCHLKKGGTVAGLDDVK